MPGHELPAFGRWLNKVFNFRSRVAGLTDSRRDPDLPGRHLITAGLIEAGF